MNIVAKKISKQKVMEVRSQPHQNSLWMLRVLIIFFKLIGLATFTHRFDMQKKRTLYIFQYSKFGIVYNAVLISLMLASNYISIPFKISPEYEDRTKLTRGIEIVQSIFGTVVICTILLFYCVDQEPLVRIMNRLTDIEHEIDCVYSLYNPMRRRRVTCNLIIVCILNTCLLIVLVTTDLLVDAYPVSWLSDILPTFHVGWLIMQYFMLVTIIQANFVDVNRALQNLSRVSTPDLRPQTLCQTRRVIVTNSTVHQLLKLRDVHCHLCEISGTVSDFYSLPILFGVTFLFLTLVYNGYWFFSPLLISDEEYEEYEDFANDVFWLIYLIYPLALLTNRITKILNEVE
ncbi:unnamed protein product [Lasius platythorax]|uniref:Gustatory receptor n=1 Tax=Lasius platythorax TaxID=488582 RepID=A0AAV2P9K6_9HYME